MGYTLHQFPQRDPHASPAQLSARYRGYSRQTRSAWPSIPSMRGSRPEPTPFPVLCPHCHSDRVIADHDIVIGLFLNRYEFGLTV